MRTRVILVTLLIALLALPVALHAQATDPVTVTEEFVEVVNKCDVDAAQEVVAEEAVVTVPQATSGAEEDEADAEGAAPATAELLGRLKSALSDEVADVRQSARLSTVPPAWWRRAAAPTAAWRSCWSSSRARRRSCRCWRSTSPTRS